MAVLRDDPYAGYNFLVTLGGIAEEGPRAAFSEVTGLAAEIEVIEYRSGSEDARVRKLPGLKKFPNLTLKRGVTGDTTFWDWLRAGLNGQVQRVDGVVTLLDETRSPVMRWRFHRGWPCRYEGPSLRAGANDVAIETLEIAHEGLELD